MPGCVVPILVRTYVWCVHMYALFLCFGKHISSSSSYVFTSFFINLCFFSLSLSLLLESSPLFTPSHFSSLTIDSFTLVSFYIFQFLCFCSTRAVSNIMLSLTSCQHVSWLWPPGRSAAIGPTFATFQPISNLVFSLNVCNGFESYQSNSEPLRKLENAWKIPPELSLLPKSYKVLRRINANHCFKTWSTNI